MIGSPIGGTFGHTKIRTMFHRLFYLLVLPLLLLGACKEGPVLPDPVDPVDEVDPVGPDTPAEAYTVSTLRYPLAQTAISGHRGAKKLADYPENCLETFAYLRDSINLLIECDVARTADGVLVLMHDNSIDRTTTGSGTLKNMDYEQLEDLYLKDYQGQVTDYRVPTFAAVCDWAKQSGTVLTVDLKGQEIEADVIALLNDKRMEENAIVITYSLDQAERIYDLDPDYAQSVSIRSDEEWERYNGKGIPPADKVFAFTGTRQSPASLYETLHDASITCIFGSLGNIDQQALSQGAQVYKDLEAKGVDILATDIPLTAAAMLAE